MVLRPRAQLEFERDIRLMSAAARWVRRLRPRGWLWLSRFLDEFLTWTREELDYQHEARFMAALHWNARDRASEEVPELVPELSTRRVLVCDLLAGPTVLDYVRDLESGDDLMAEQLAALGFEPEVLARHLVENFVSDAFQYGLFHADLHPANLIIRPGNALGYVDFGITGSLSPYARQTILSLILAMTEGDADALFDHFRRFARLDPGADLAAFRRGLDDGMERWFEHTGHAGARRLRASFTTIMLELLALSHKTGVWPTPDVVRYLRSVITADGLIARFAPGLDVTAHLHEICRRQLVADLREKWLSAPALADWSRSAARIALEGPEALASLLRTVTETGLPVDMRGSAPAAGGGRSGRRALQAAVVGAAGLVTAASTPPVLGFNLFTVALGLGLAASAIFLVRLPGLR